MSEENQTQSTSDVETKDSTSETVTPNEPHGNKESGIIQEPEDTGDNPNEPPDGMGTEPEDTGDNPNEPPDGMGTEPDIQEASVETVTKPKATGAVNATYIDSGEEVELRVTEDSTGKCIRVAYYAGAELRKIVWEPARTWSRN